MLKWGLKRVYNHARQMFAERLTWPPCTSLRPTWLMHAPTSLSCPCVLLEWTASPSSLALTPSDTLSPCPGSGFMNANTPPPWTVIGAHCHPRFLPLDALCSAVTTCSTSGAPLVTASRPRVGRRRDSIVFVGATAGPLPVLVARKPRSASSRARLTAGSPYPHNVAGAPHRHRRSATGRAGRFPRACSALTHRRR
jgi:hypothetical protein